MRTILISLLIATAYAPWATAAEPQDSCDRQCKMQADMRNFLITLQNAVRANDRNRVIALTRVPLRVNRGPKNFSFYRTKASIMANFDRIFTHPVKQAILQQDPADMFIRGDDAMVGSGEIWFNSPCLDRFCQARGRVTIHAVNVR